MEIQARESDWTGTDEENLAKFLSTGTGTRLLPKLVSEMPALLAGGDINAILIRSGEVRAYQACVEHLFLLAHPVKPATSGGTEYPPLEDDKAWADGQSLQPPTETPKS